MAKPVPEQAVTALTRNPAAIGSVALSLVGTLLYLLPVIGVKVPTKVSKIANVAMTLGATFGFKLLVKPS
jgi:hypothetical protein